MTAAPLDIIDDPIEVAVAWFIAARAMVLAGGREPEDDDAAAGLYAQAILGLSESDCLAAKDPVRLEHTSLAGCLATFGRLPADARESIVTGVMMLTYADHEMTRLEVRWASMLASAAGLDVDEFHRCCSSARVIAAMLRPSERRPDATAGAMDP